MKPNCALIMIDMQNGFISPESPLYIQGAAGTVSDCAGALDAARLAGMPVFHVNRLYSADGSDVELSRARAWSEGGKPLTPGSESALPPDALKPLDGERVIIKPRYSAFFCTQLDLILRRMGVTAVALMGTTTPNCIRSTCYDADSLDYAVTVLSDCCSSRTEEIQRANLEDMSRIGAEITTWREFFDCGADSK